MPSWIPLLILVIIIFLVLVAVKAQQKGGEAGFHYLPAKTLFTTAERSFLGVLDQAVGAEYRVFGKVRVADVVTLKPGLSKSMRQGALNRVAFKHFDYVICRASDLVVVCVVELNDKSHASARAQSRDALVRKVCEGIQLPLLTITAKASYNVDAIRTQFNAAISPPVLNSARNKAEFTF